MNAPPEAAELEARGAMISGRMATGGCAAHIRSPQGFHLLLLLSQTIPFRINRLFTQRRYAKANGSDPSYPLPEAEKLSTNMELRFILTAKA
jgi:hypothetical protein